MADSPFDRRARRRGWILLAAVVLAVGGIALALELTGNPPEEVVEMVGEGGEKVLREPMRPPRGGPRVLVLALDGVGDAALREVLAAGALPRTSALLGGPAGDDGIHPHAWAAPDVLSILPSTTYAAWASVFTGEPPARTGIPGNEWFAREEMRYYAPAPVSVTGHEHAMEVYTDQLVGRVLAAPTVFERADVRSYVSLQAVQRGADLLTIPTAAGYGEMITAAARGVVGDEPVQREAYAELDRTAVESLIASIREHGVADLQVVYFPGVDLYTHVATDPLAEQRRYLAEVVDPAVGALAEAYRAAGALDSTWVVIVSDHGHTPVLPDDRHALEAEGDDEPPEVLRLAGFRVRPMEIEPQADERDYQAVFAYQGAFAYVYLADRSTCASAGNRCDWSRPPRLEEDVLAAARAFHAASATGAGVPAMRGTLDLVFARPPRAPGRDALPFQVWDGARLVDVGDYLARNPRPDLLDLERRLEGLAAGPYGHRAGDVLLLARTGMERPIGERFYFSGHYHSWHGSPSAQDSRIPLVVANASVGGAAIRDRVRRAAGPRPDQLSVTPLILDLLGRGP